MWSKIYLIEKYEISKQSWWQHNQVVLNFRGEKITESFVGVYSELSTESTQSRCDAQYSERLNQVYKILQLQAMNKICKIK